jgi:hypothetical protein
MTTIFISISLSESFGHRSGCHRWHTCPSDTGSYTYVPKVEKFEDDDEKPKYDRCPNGYNRNDEGICKKKIENDKNNQYENKYGYKEKDYSPTYKNDFGSTKNNFFGIFPEDYYSPDDYNSDLLSTDNTLDFNANDYPSDDINNLYNNDYDKNRGLFSEDSVTDNKNKCNPISESILLKKKLNPKGIILLSEFDTCQIANGKIMLKIPDNPNLKLVAMYIDKNGNNHEGTLLSPIKIQNIDKKQGLFTLELNEQMKGKNPITGKSNTLTKINGLALYNDGYKAIKFKSGNVAELTATFSK